MLEHTFIHIPGIGAKSEQRMWDQGTTSVYQLREQVEESWHEAEGEPTRAMVRMRDMVDGSARALDERNWSFFCQHLPSSELWRLLGMGLRTAYLDIETTGLGHYDSVITTIGVYDGDSWKAYIYGRNLDEFPDEIGQYDLLVTYNGKTFDVPFINAFFGMRLNMPHVDLRYPLAARGYKGGLKKIERDLDLHREGALADVDGFMAVLLWREWAERGDRSALDTLLAYNLEDVFNLQPLAARVFNLSLPEPFRHLNLPENRIHPIIPFEVNAQLVNRLKGNFRFG